MSPKEKENTERISTFLSKQDYEAVKEIARKEGSNVSLIIRRAVKEYLSKQK